MKRIESFKNWTVSPDSNIDLLELGEIINASLWEDVNTVYLIGDVLISCNYIEELTGKSLDVSEYYWISMSFEDKKKLLQNYIEYPDSIYEKYEKLWYPVVWRIEYNGELAEWVAEGEEVEDFINN